MTKQLLRDLALGIVVVIALFSIFNGGGSTTSLFGANQCASGQTCMSSLELTGPNSGVTNALQVDSGAFVLGPSGSSQTQQIATTCNPTADTSVSATSTGYMFCTGVTGVTSSSQVFAQIATSTNAIGAQWLLVGAKASTTAGAIDFKIMNLTGTAAVPSASAGASFASSTRLWIVN